MSRGGCASLSFHWPGEKIIIIQVAIFSLLSYTMVVSRYILLFAILLLFAPPAGGEVKPGQKFTAEVVRVVDGDTYKFRVPLLNVVVQGTCRTRHYNAPELRGEEGPKGIEARARLKELIEGKTVTILAGETADRYGRWVCETWLLDGRSVDKAMREYLKDYPGLDRYKALH